MEIGYKVSVVSSDKISDIKILYGHGWPDEGNDGSNSTEGGEAYAYRSI